MEENIYSEITLKHLERFRMARYVIISPNPEDDVNRYMERYAKDSGLLDIPGYMPRLIGWDFPFVTEEQQKNFGLRGYVAAFIIPEDFTPKCPGAELAYCEADTYAVITVTDPFSDPFQRIPGGYKKLFSYIQENGLGLDEHEGHLCFEEVREENGRVVLDIYLPAAEK